jgi:PIN domain nuclease of toxin-antitoxin system
MKALLDTHTFLWWNLDDPQLSEKARNFISDGRNEIFLSAASAWEIAIKAAKGRLILPEAPDQYVANRMRYHRFKALPIEISHALHVFDLPQIHTDPFDRLLIAQGQMESMPILTADSEIGSYPIEIVW